jgi:hypothetical protein
LAGLFQCLSYWYVVQCSRSTLLCADYVVDTLDYASQGRDSDRNEYLKGTVDVARVGGDDKHNPYRCYKDFLDKRGCAFAGQCRYSHEDYSFAEMLWIYTNGHIDHLESVADTYYKRYPATSAKFGGFRGIPIAPVTPASAEEIDSARSSRDKGETGASRFSRN